MPHNFSNDDKIGALMIWADRLQERVDRLKDAIQTADVLNSVTGVPDIIRDWGVMNAVDKAKEFGRYAHRYAEPHDRIRVSPDRYDEAVRVAGEIAEVQPIDGPDAQRAFNVPVWATERVVSRLQRAGIRHLVGAYAWA